MPQLTHIWRGFDAFRASLALFVAPRATVGRATPKLHPSQSPRQEPHMSNLSASQQSRRELTIGLIASVLVIGLAIVLPPSSKPSQPVWALAAHISAAVIALPLGAWVLFFSQKGTALHKRAGYAWVTLMLIAAFSAFFIQSWGRFSPIHIFSVWTPISLFLGIRAAQRGDIKSHIGNMRGSFYGLIIAGVLSVALPGRFLWRFFASMFA
jgi:uncharacterized membrane protein